MKSKLVIASIATLILLIFAFGWQLVLVGILIYCAGVITGRFV